MLALHLSLSVPNIWF